jgi:hypothetical protein
LSARSSLKAVACQHVPAFGLHFKLVVWEWGGKVGNPPSIRSGSCVQKGEAAAGLAESDRRERC